MKNLTISFSRIILLVILIYPLNVFGYEVTSISAAHQNGQTFLTWDHNT
ncbi:MAG: hypothetical protein H7Y00_16955, partial [Fimbriimonadaceae bacterium]|nr:hypothetical protein [Chitinophagales bacterium]